MHLIQQNQLAEIKTSFEGNSGQRVRRQMLVALTLLLAALIVTLTRDRDFWFPSAPVVQSQLEPIDEAVPAAQVRSEAANAATQPAAAARLKAKSHTPPSASPARPNPFSTLATSRAVLPPLQVEVVAGDEHRPLQGGTSSVKVDLQAGNPAPSAKSSSAREASNSYSMDAVPGQAQLSPGAAEIVSRSVEPNYPLLAKQMKVEGAVVLDALIGRDGNIQRLHVLSGPKILSAAAREAVQQWRFRPYLQSGQPMETESRITVNFTIWTR